MPVSIRWLRVGIASAVGVALVMAMGARVLRRAPEERGLRPLSERLAFKAWAWLAGRPALYRWLTRRAARYLSWLAGEDGRIRIFGLAPGWTAGRDLPVAGNRTFHELYKARKRA